MKFIRRILAIFRRRLKPVSLPPGQFNSWAGATNLAMRMRELSS